MSNEEEWIEHEIPLAWGCYLAVGGILLLVITVFVLTLVAVGVL